jgi:hypothetical protein
VHHPFEGAKTKLGITSPTCGIAADMGRIIVALSA